MNRPSLARLLGTLLAEGSAPVSRFSAAARAALAPQFAAGILREERSGPGGRITVLNKTVLEAFAAGLFPSGLAMPSASAAPRAAAVGHYRDAKAAATTSAEPVLLRAFGDLMFERCGEELPAAELTARYGTASFLLTRPPFWACRGTLAVVENLEPFLYFKKLNIPSGAAVYAGGKMSARLLAWLASAEMAGCDYVHCGDYDPVGLDEYLRLKQACGARVKLHIPANIEALFRKYGKRDLLTDSESVLRRLRATKDPDALRIIALMNAANAGLEQESLLLP